MEVKNRLITNVAMTTPPEVTGFWCRRFDMSQVVIPPKAGMTVENCGNTKKNLVKKYAGESHHTGTPPIKLPRYFASLMFSRDFMPPTLKLVIGLISQETITSGL